MRTLWGTVLAAVSLLAQAPNPLNKKDAAEGWLLLFDGETLFGWTQEGRAAWRAQDGLLIGEGERGLLRTNSAFSEYVLLYQFRSRKERPPGGEAKSEEDTYTLPGGAKLERRGHWHSYAMMRRSNHFLETLDERTISTGKKQPVAPKRIDVEYTGNDTTEYRRIQLIPLDSKLRFKRGSLSGWRVLDAPEQKERAVWSVRDGRICVKGGPGRLETKTQFQDFILQLEMTRPSGTVLLNGRNLRVDLATGEIRDIEHARPLPEPPDSESATTLTINALGRHVSVWINGYLVTDWEDTRPAAKPVPGSIVVEGSDLEFALIYLAPL